MTAQLLVAANSALCSARFRSHSSSVGPPELKFALFLKLRNLFSLRVDLVFVT